jgi:hypothetical protein
VQACHACLEAARDLLSPGDEHPHLVLGGVSSERRLRLILHRMQRLRIDCRLFHAADLDGELTAIATASARRLPSAFPAIPVPARMIAPQSKTPAAVNAIARRAGPAATVSGARRRLW